MKTALIHDWLLCIAGAEKVLQAIYEIYPAPIYTLIKNEKSSFFQDKDIHTSFIQKLPFAKKKYRSFLPLFPLAIEQFDLSSFDVVISSSSCVSKGVLTHSQQLHICYCHTPMRYSWDQYHQYLFDSGYHKGLKGMLARCFLHYIRMWDVHTSIHVDHFIANSSYVAKRIKKVYNKESKVIYPPIDTNFFSLASQKDSFYVTASRMVSYKKMDLIVEAFSKMLDKKLLVIGEGPEFKKIRSKASKNIEFLGFQSDENLKTYLQKAKAFVFAAEEDFGIILVEAMSTGTPVIAYNKGGAKETVIENKTGLFFEKQEVQHIIDAVHTFETKEFDPKKIREHALKFSCSRFKKEFQEYVEEKKQEFFLRSKELINQ